VSLAQSMTVVEISRPGGPEVLKPGTRPVPSPKAGEVLIRCEASSVNRLDCFQRQGIYPIPPGASDIPGLDVAGTIVALGEGVTRWRVGDAVCALVTGGGYAEYCTASAACCLPIPAGLGMVEAAALPETFFTVWSNLFMRAGLKAGESVLIHGGSGGVGTTAIQIAAARGARVFATAGSAEKCRSCEALGAERGIDYKTESFAEVVLAATDGRGVNVVLDVICGDAMQDNLRALAVEGRLVTIAMLQGSKIAIDYAPVMLKRLVLTGATLRAREVAYKAEIAAVLEREVWPLLASGRIRVPLERTVPLREVAEAHRLMEANGHTGKIGLTI